MIKQRLAYIISTLILAFSLPSSVIFAEEPIDPSANTNQNNTTPSTTPPPAPAANPPAQTIAPTAPGPNAPNGADASTFTYNPDTGLWENELYTWNPSTRQTSPKTPQDYSYNPATGKWDTTKYAYDAPSGKYVPNTVSEPNNPQAPAALSATTPNSNTIDTTGPNSNSTINSNSDNNGFFNLFYNGAISNGITLNASTGDATVANNTYGGSALTGNALDVSNIINMLSSSFGLQDAANLLTFTKNIDGNVVGDIIIDPNQLGPNSVTVSNSNSQNNLTINANGNGAINNDINLGANSGNATVANNTHAGNATSGNADAVANVVNILNSAIAANRSFLGVININGNLDGDILLPPSFLDQLIASNAPHATINVSNNLNNNVTVNSTNNDTINNNIKLAATSGNADVSNNTHAGSATTGSAGTNLTIFNLTGKQVVAKDSMLVFVNVLGQWVGLIMDAPNGSTAAALGGNVSQNNNVSNNVVANLNNNSAINNIVNVNSQSGDASVTNNTNAGNAQSGKASASANIANIIDSQLFASDWFGLLFINVLGFWHGSFGVNTDAGNFVNTPTANSIISGSSSSAARSAIFRFIPKNNGQNINSAVAASFAHASGDLGSSGSSIDNAKKAAAVGVITNGSGGHGGNTAPITTHGSERANRADVWILPMASFIVVILATGALGGSGEFTDKLHARLLSSRLKKA
jgi:hypothetical protein